MENNQTTRTMAMEDLHLIRQVLDQTAPRFRPWRLSFGGWGWCGCSMGFWRFL